MWHIIMLTAYLGNILTCVQYRMHYIYQDCMNLGCQNWGASRHTQKPLKMGVFSVFQHELNCDGHLGIRLTLFGYVNN
jgi:hypothetical protein